MNKKVDKVIGAKKRTIYIGHDRKTAYIVYDCSAKGKKQAESKKKDKSDDE